MTFPLTMGGRYLPVRDARLLLPALPPKLTPDEERLRLAARKRELRAKRLRKELPHG